MKVLKKLTTAAVLAVVCTSTLAGCGSSSTVNGGADTTAAKTEQTEKAKEESGVEETAGGPQYSGSLSYWSSWNSTEPQAKVIEAAAAEFMKLYPEVKIDLTFNGRDNRKLVNPALQGGQQIDMYDANADNIQAYWMDTIIPLDDYYEQTYLTTNGEKYIDVIMPSMVSLAHQIGDDKLYYVPYCPQAFMWFCNKTIFEDAGITKVPTTWEEFTEVCQTLKDAGYTPITTDDKYAENMFGYYLSRLKGNDFVEKLAYDTTGELWNDPAVLETAKVFEDMAAKGYFASNVGSNTLPLGQQEMVLEEKIAMYLNGTWLPNEVKDTAGSDFNWGEFAFTTVPGGVDGLEAGAYGSYGIAINNKCQNPDTAFAFAVYLTTGEWDQKMSEEAAAIPMSNDAQWPESLKDAKTVFDQLTYRYPSQTAIRMNSDTQPIIETACIKLYAGQITAEQFISECRPK